MEFQQRKYSCGASALRAALYMLGHNVQEATIRRRANTTPQEGTDEKGLIRALAYYGYKGAEFNNSSGKRAWSWLKNNLSKGRPVLLCVNQWEHWVCVLGTIGKDVIVFDPEKVPGRRRQYSGLQVYNEIDLLDRWVYEEDGQTSFYGLAIKDQ